MLLRAGSFALAIVLAVLPADARTASSAARNSRSAPADGPTGTEATAAWTSGTVPAANCARTRRKLWQEGEGWIVKTITMCH